MKEACLENDGAILLQLQQHNEQAIALLRSLITDNPDMQLQNIRCLPMLL